MDKRIQKNLEDWLKNPSNRKHPWNHEMVSTPGHLVALAAASKLRDEYEGRMAELVADAREKGETWQAIADMLGVSRQAAQKKYGS